MRRETDRDGRLSRRAMLRMTLLGAGGAALAARGALAEDAVLVTELPEHQQLIAALQYVNQSTVEGRNCGNCLLYQGGDAPKGKCTLFRTGVVPATGWCASWAPRS